jgi:polyferredoxin
MDSCVLETPEGDTMSKIKQNSRRQRVRKALLYISLLLLPITLYYLSPYVIVASASQGIVNGSFVVFALMFVSALFLGRLWCGWVCPAGALQEFACPINNKPMRGGWRNLIKWGIWVPWIGIIAFLAISAGGYREINVFHMLESGVSLNQPFWYYIYYIVIILFLGLALLFGKRAGCHYICWMAPFIILGRRIRNLLRWPALRLRVNPDKCIDCNRCTQSCPMSLDVNQMVHDGDMENAECILCGSCVDVCPKQVIHFSFSGGK